MFIIARHIDGELDRATHTGRRMKFLCCDVSRRNSGGKVHLTETAQNGAIFSVPRHNSGGMAATFLAAIRWRRSDEDVSGGGVIERERGAGAAV